MNKVILRGRLGHDVSLRYAPKTETREEMAVATFSLAVRRKKNDAGEIKTDWVECVAFNALAETIKRWFSKGSGIEIVGRIRTRKYESRKYKNAETGEPARLTATEIVIEEFEFADAAEKPQEKTEEPVPGFKSADEDIPF